MKIAYVAQWDVSQESGVLKKMAAQVRAWVAEGHQVCLFVLTRHAGISAALHGLPVETVVCPQIRHGVLRAGALVQRVLAWQPDVVYLRFYLYYPALERLMRAIPTYLEINSNDLTEFRHNHPLSVYLYHRATRGRILRQARGIVSVSHEVAASLRAHQKPLLVIGNGIDLSQCPAAPAPHNDEPQLVFLGSARHIWQGVDKILILATQLPQWQFHLIGEMTEAIQQSRLPNVHIHGYLSEAQYVPLLQAADAAFGPLALYRKQMQETSAPVHKT